jgi:uncharacterized protein YjbK
MSQEIEIEFKNMLTEEEFTLLKQRLDLKETDFTIQHNDYFDTSQFLLKEKRCALRIRERDGRFVFTLKQPLEKGLLETHQPLSVDQVQHFFSSKILPDGEVVTALEQLSIPLSSLVHLGRLTTDRAEIKQSDGLLVLDHSYYFDQEDFEFEFETSDYESGKAAFNQLLSNWELPLRIAENKLYRFYTYKTKNKL